VVKPIERPVPIARPAFACQKIPQAVGLAGSEKGEQGALILSEAAMEEPSEHQRHSGVQWRTLHEQLLYSFPQLTGDDV